jgi:hypothetical protein
VGKSLPFARLAFKIKIMIKKILIIFCLAQGSIYAQGPWNNLVSNYSFEEMDLTSWLESGLGSSVLGLGDMRYTGCGDCFDDLNNYEKIQQYWSYSSHWTVPKRRYATCGFPGEDPVCTPDITYEPLTSDDGVNSEYQRDYSGQFCAYTGAGAGEFVVIEPESTIEKNKFYYIEAFVSGDDKVSPQMGTIDLFTEKPHVCSYNKYITEYGGNGPSQTVLLSLYPNPTADVHGWIRYRGYFQATEDFEWLSIGSAATLYWDDIKIIAVSENLCRDNWYFDNTVFNYPKEVFQASNNIVAGTGVDPEATHQPGPVYVLGNSHTIFRAGNDIILEDGFEIDEAGGAIFETIIEPCQDICPPVSFSYARFDCVSNPTPIGGEEYDATLATFSWFPTTYLDDPNSGNPTFTPPPGENGTIIYTVHYEKDCYIDDFNSAGIFIVVVNYSDGLDTPAEVTHTGLTYDNYSLETTIEVNDVVDEVNICYTNADGVLICFTYYRGIDFDDGEIDFAVNHLATSCCADLAFTVTAESYCGSVATTSFNWMKTGDFGFVGVLPNIFTPLTPDGDNDEYCFEVNKACFYTFEVIHPWGTTLFSTSGSFIDGGYVCPWDGRKDNGVMLPNGNYWVDIRLYNDCGEEEFRHALVHIPSEGMMQEEGSGEESNSSQYISDLESDIGLLREGNQIYLSDQNTENKTVIITDNLGRVIIKDNFTTDYNVYLANGLYFLSVVSNDLIVYSEKLVIL